MVVKKKTAKVEAVVLDEQKLHLLIGKVFKISHFFGTARG